MKRIAFVILLAALVLSGCGHHEDAESLTALREQIQGYEERIAAVQYEITGLTQDIQQAQTIYDEYAAVHSVQFDATHAQAAITNALEYTFEQLQAQGTTYLDKMQAIASEYNLPIHLESVRYYLSRNPAVAATLSQLWGGEVALGELSFIVRPHDVAESDTVIWPQYTLVSRMGHDQYAILTCGVRWPWESFVWWVVAYDSGDGLVMPEAPFEEHIIPWQLYDVWRLGVSVLW